jgi:hypothetical protein
VITNDVSDYIRLLVRTTHITHRRYLYFDVVVGLAFSNDPESYAGGSVATGRASHAGQVKGDDPDKKGYPGYPGGGLGHGADNPIPIK